jgi:hypothetical protein
MADVKISGLPTATTPLNGADLVPLVQNNVTSQATIEDLTAGRNVSAASLTISNSSSSNALRITQTGTGNALVVEDSANPDISPFVIDATGNVISGYTTTVATQNYGGSPVTPKIQLQGTGQDTSSISTFNWGTSLGSPANLILNKSIGGSIGTRGALTAANTDIGSISFNGDDGTNFIPAAAILVETDGTPGTNDMPGRLVFSTTADGASTPTERMRIDSVGDVGIGTTNPITKLEVAGNNNATWAVTASITGATMDVTAVSSGTIAVGDLVFASGVAPYTRVTAFGTGSGGIGTYTVSVFQTVASALLSGASTYGNTLIRITEADTSVAAGQPIGGLQFFTSDSSTPTAGVGAYVASISESITPDSALVFGTRDNSGGGVDANERMRIDSAGNVGIGITNPTARLNVVDATTQDAVRITQTGTGNAFVVEDAANPDSSPFVIDANGRMVNGNTAPLTTFSSGTGFVQQIGTTTGGATHQIALYNTISTNNPIIELAKANSATIGTNSAVGSGSDLGEFLFSGADGTNFIPAASITAAVDGTPGTNDMPGRLVFSTTADGAATPTERMRIKSTGQVRFVPQTEPATAQAGDVYYDSGTNKLRCYNGSIWNDLF